MNAEERVSAELPFSRVVPVRSIGEDGLKASFEASPQECAALAQTFELECLDLFAGQYELKPGRNSKFVMKAAFSARLVQQCVVTLDPIDSELAETFALEFVPQQDGDPAPILDLEPDGLPIEPYNGAKIDVGAALAQQLSLAIDPYPRKAGAKLDWSGDEDGDGGAVQEGPFSALARLGRDQRD